MTGQDCPDLLSAAAEARLVCQVQSPDHHISSIAFVCLERSFEKFIARYERRIGFHPSEKLEIQQALRCAFYQAVRNFDTCRNARLSTFAKKHLEGAVVRLRERHKIRRHISLEELLEQSEHSLKPEVGAYLSDGGREATAMTDDIVRAEVVVPALHEFVMALTPSQRRVASHLFILDESQSEAARSLGISRQAVSNTYERIVMAGCQQLQSLVITA